MNRYQRPCWGGPCTDKGMTEPGFCVCKAESDEIGRLRTALVEIANGQGLTGDKCKIVATEALLRT